MTKFNSLKSEMNRRDVLRTGAVLGGAAAMSSFISIDASAAGAATVNMQ
jgi:hypothetical protein